MPRLICNRIRDGHSYVNISSGSLQRYYYSVMLWCIFLQGWESWCPTFCRVLVFSTLTPVSLLPIVNRRIDFSPFSPSVIWCPSGSTLFLPRPARNRVHLQHSGNTGKDDCLWVWPLVCRSGDKAPIYLFVFSNCFFRKEYYCVGHTILELFI